ncbi:AAA family ATPase [Sphingomonas sp. BK345]|uniref:AAA family ATPase n=1 Tax=Sphingomonas sp. BK345 TaxID=2586980 RepID=UPI001620DBFF|nr:AAA family ATPase [Sphingomonas sp. BK345]MBB3475595.1 hypothetical protein [Sphingomonas sp. BK345]
MGYEPRDPRDGAEPQNRDASDDFVEFGPGSVKAALDGAKPVPRNYDFCDMAIEQGGEAVRAALAKAQYVDQKTKQALAKPVPEYARRLEREPYRISTPYEWRDPTTIRPRDFIYGRRYARSLLTGIIAPGAIGKTTMQVGDALAMATGRPLLGHTVRRPLRVWLWNLEDDQDELARMIQAACKHWGIDRADLSDRLVIDNAMNGLPLCITEQTENGPRIDEQLCRAITDELTHLEIDYLNIDPFVSSHGVEENDNVMIDRIAKRWAKIAADSATAISVTHHTSKLGSVDVTAMSARGAVALINACRSVITLNRMSEAEADRYGIKGEARRRYFRTYDDKGNRAPPADQSDWVKLISIDLDNAAPATADEPAIPSDNVGVATPWTPPNAFAGITSGDLLRVQEAVEAGEWKEHHTASDWVGKAVAETLGFDADDKSDKARIKSLLKEWVANKRFKVEQRLDRNRQEKKFLVVDQWVDPTTATPPSSVA